MKKKWQDSRITPDINYAYIHCLKKTKDRTILSLWDFSYCFRIFFLSLLWIPFWLPTWIRGWWIWKRSKTWIAGLLYWNGNWYLTTKLRLYFSDCHVYDHVRTYASIQSHALNKKTPKGVYAGCVGVRKNYGYVGWQWKVE